MIIEATLEAVTLPEALLHGMQFVSVCNAFDRLDGSAIGLYREHRAGFDRSPIDGHGACTAVAGVAADMCTRQTKVVSQIVNEKGSRRNFTAGLCSVD